MARTAFLLAGWLVLALGSSAHAEDQIVRDRQGRIVQRISEEGVAVWYRYDASGQLAEERRSDGSVVRHDADSARSAPERR